MKSLHGFKMRASAHEVEHVFPTFPSCQGALKAFNSFYLTKLNTFGFSSLLKGGDGKSPKFEKT
jgi:hypothetical protein